MILLLSGSSPDCVWLCLFWFGSTPPGSTFSVPSPSAVPEMLPENYCVY